MYLSLSLYIYIYIYILAAGRYVCTSVEPVVFNKQHKSNKHNINKHNINNTHINTNKIKTSEPVAFARRQDSLPAWKVCAREPATNIIVITILTPNSNSSNTNTYSYTYVGSRREPGSYCYYYCYYYCYVYCYYYHYYYIIIIIIIVKTAVPISSERLTAFGSFALPSLRALSPRLPYRRSPCPVVLCPYPV